METEALPRSALRGVAFSQWAYWCSLAGAVLSLTYLPPGSVRIMVMLAPLMTAALCVATTWWSYEACDEYLRAQILRGVAVTAVVMAAATLGYFILELLGLPRLSMLWVNLFGWSVFNLQMLFVIYRSR